MRALLLAFLLLGVAGCGRGEEQRRPGPAPSQAASARDSASQDDRIACATEGAAQWERVCMLDRAQSPKGQVLTLYSPSGSFRRLLVATDGRGVVAADGAEPARVRLVSASEIEVAIGGDRYRLPAHLK